MSPTTKWDSYVRHDELYGCWLWAGKLDRDGYPMFGHKRAHRYIYSQERGPIGKGLELDHRCRRRSCVRPGHLDAVKRSENELRKSWRRRLRMMPCKLHDSYEAIRTPEGGRLCRKCDV